MPKFRFIHTADLHLGSMLHISRIDLTREIADISAEATYKAFKRICDAAVEKEADFLLISGDLYDREARSVRANSFFAEQCKMLNEHAIKVFVIAGNHDPVSEQRNELFDLPPNVRIFGSDSPEAQIVKNRKGAESARIIGQSYRNKEESRKMHLEYAAPDDGLCNIALLHTQLEPGNSSYVPCSLPELKNVANVHYWALGHVHKHGILNKSNPAVAFSGIPQGRDIGETGPGCFLLVDMDGTKILSMEPIQVSPVIWKSVEVNLEDGEGAENITDVEDKIMIKAKDIIDTRLQGETSNVEGYVVEWIIRGKSKIHELLSERTDETAAELTEKLNTKLMRREPFILTERIKILTQKWQSDEDIRKKPMYGEIVRMAAEYARNDLKQNALKEKLRNIWEFNADAENGNETKLQMSENLYTEIIERAKTLILEKLPEGSDGL